ncbi:MAG: MerR family transcriptional regulator [Actinomycetota bacterium]|nr:MerR family transcriptional regulator [Actinomycetota bacterium]
MNSKRTRVTTTKASAPAGSAGEAEQPADLMRGEAEQPAVDQDPADLIRMGELAEASGVSAATIKHYLREGLLPEPVKTSRNMAYYPAEFVERIRLIKQLQEERYMPLRVIKDLLDEDPGRARNLIELGDRLLERAKQGEEQRTPAAEVRQRYAIPQEALDRLAELEVVTPDADGFSPTDLRIIAAIASFRAGGYDERIGFTVYDTLRYKKAMAELVKQEVDVLMDRLAGEMDAARALELIESGVEPLNELMAALRTKQLVAELEHRRGGADGADEGG